MKEMSDRTYCAEILRIWGTDILRAQEMVDKARRPPYKIEEGEYQIVMDPEDFLDLCAGKWHHEGDDISDAPATPTAPEDPIAHARNSMMYWHERAMTAESHRDELAAALRKSVAAMEHEFDTRRCAVASMRALHYSRAILARIEEGKR